MQPRSPHDPFSPHLDKPLPPAFVPTAVSPTFSRVSGMSYQQPLGTGAQSRSQTGTPASLSSSVMGGGGGGGGAGGFGMLGGGGIIGGGSSSRARSRSRTRSEESVLAQATGEKLTRLVECDLVLDNVEKDRNGQWLLPEGALLSVETARGARINKPKLTSYFARVLSRTDLRTFIVSLGPLTSSHYYGFRPPSSEVRPSTPRKAGRIDPVSVRNSLKELWMTEKSYKLKISSLLKDFATPLRSFAVSETTRVIDAWSAKKLFINIEHLVPISVAFEDDLRRVAEEVGMSERRGANGGQVPQGFGEMILHHVRRMAPYKTWLTSYELARQTRVELETTNKNFTTFVGRIELSLKEYANTTVGFRDILAEPHQRVARYGLMIDPIIRHLPPSDENVPYLEEALEVLNEICAMEVDEQTTKAAVMWSLVQSIDKFPAQLINSSRYFIYSIDVDELVDQNTSLRVTLFLFNDLVLIVKRPNGRETGRSLAGLDDIPSLMSLYSTSSLPGVGGGPSSFAGSPKKTKKKDLGYRGHAFLHELYLVDLGGCSFGLFLENPPSDIPKGERWNGRHVRRFEVARHAYPNDVREVEKDVFLQKIMAARAELKSKKGLGEGRAGRREGLDDDGFRTYWQICERAEWERAHGMWKNRLALQVDNSGTASDISFDREGRVQVASRLMIRRDQSALFSVRFRNRQEGEPEIISLDRMSSAVDRIASNYGLTDFPAGTTRPSTPGGSGRGRSRPLSFMGVVNALGNGLKRTQSTNSRASNATSSGVGGWGTPNSNSESGVLDGNYSPGQQSLFGSVSGSGVGMDSSVDIEKPGSRGDRGATELGAGGGVVTGSPNWFGNRSEAKSPARPGESKLDETTSGETDVDDDQEEEGNTTAEVDLLRSSSNVISAHEEAIAPRPRPPQVATYSRTSSSSFALASPVHLSSPDHSNRTLGRSTDGSSTGEVLLPACLPLTPRRRPMGPRDMGSRPTTPSGLSPARAPSPLAPFERETSPTVPPASREPSPPVGKRPLIEASPRASPAKKVAALYQEQVPRRPSPTETTSRASSGSSRRNVSGGHGQRKVGRRIVSSTSTIRAPLSDLATASRPADVFDAEPKALPPPPPQDEVDDEMASPELDTLDAPPLDRLTARLLVLRNEVSILASNKENRRGPAAGLSRSPSTRNLKSIAKESRGSLANAVAFDRYSSHVDPSELIRWFEELSGLVEECRSSAPAETLTSSLPSEAEFETLTFEREMMQEDLKLLRERYTEACAENVRQHQELGDWSSRYKTVHDAWKVLGQEIETLYSTFAEEIKAVEEIYQAENGTARTRALERGMAEAVAERSCAQHEAARLRQELVMERAERVELERKLRVAQHQPHA